MSPASRVLGADQPDRGDVFLFVLSVRAGSGRLASEPGRDQRGGQLVAGLEQECIEQGPVFALGIEVLDQPVER